MTGKQKRLLLRIAVALVMVVILYFLPVRGWLRFALYLLAYFVIGCDILKKAVQGLWNRRVFDENFLMTVATVGAFALAMGGGGDYTEAVAVMLFYQLGELFQSIAVGKSRKSIAKLMDIRPDYANVERDGQPEQVDPQNLPVGTEILVCPGERIPLDGIVLEGSSQIDTSALTGESLPREAVPGAEVISGCVNLTGLLKLRTTKSFGASTVSRILELVENAGSRRAKPERFLSKFARFYTPAVCIGALVLALLPPLVRLLFLQLPPLWEEWIYRGLSFLVISCPCALVISIPLTFFAGIGGASRGGILIKGANYLETLSKTRTVVLDKTGTLTWGSFCVSRIESLCLPREQLLEYAALAESASSHPIGKSIVAAWGKEIERSRVSHIQELSGKGVTALVDGKSVAVGNGAFLKELDIFHTNCKDMAGTVHVALQGSYAGYIVMQDQLKPTAKTALQELRKVGVRRLVMLSGDREAATAQTAGELGISEFRSGLLPQDKVRETEKLLAEKKEGESLAFVGDGVNDAPALSRADVGMAMGALGSDAAIEAADIVLMDDDPRKLAQAIRHSRRCMGIVYENIIFALSVKLLCLLLGALGMAGLWLAIFADVGVMVLAVLNAMRALLVKKV